MAVWEDAIKEFVRAYAIEVPSELVEHEYRECLQIQRHRMIYGQMSGSSHLNPLEQMRIRQETQEALQAQAYDTVKEELVIRDVIAKCDFQVTPEELLGFAREIAERQNTTLDMVRSFFGQDLAMLESDVKRQKALQWICDQAAHAQ